MLEKLFIKDYKNVDNPNVRLRYGMLAGIFGLVSNTILCIGKLVVGLIGKSITIVADAINNLSDAGSSVVTMFGFKMANKPADEKHPYGHARYEYITALIVALIVFFLGALFGKESIDKIINPEKTTVSVVTYVILAVAISMKLWQFMIYRRFSKAISSDSLKASSVDSLNDVISTTAVLGATILIDLLPDVKVSIDGIFGLAVSVFILISGIKLISSTINPLLGEKPDEELVEKIKNKIMSYDGVLGLHDLMIHNYGEGRNFAMVHIEVSASIDVMESHEMIDKIEQDFKNQMGIHLSVHMDPIEVDNPLVTRYKSECKRILLSLDKELNLHDFRVVVGKMRTNILFDVVVPFEVKLTAADIVKELETGFKGDEGMEYHFIIDIDRDYVSNAEEDGKENKDKKARKNKKEKEKKEKEEKENV